MSNRNTKGSLNMRRVKITELIPADYNPRVDLQPGDKDFEKIKHSIDKYGFVEPIVWNEKTGHIVGGHQRFKILVSEGVKEIDCVVVNLSLAEEMELNSSLNKAQGDWDYDKLPDFFNLILEYGGDLGDTGFDAAEIEEIMKPNVEDNVEDDNFDVDEELEKPAVSKSGDVWLLGNHRLVVGDSTKPETYEKLMDGKKANLVVTDPPYNVNYEGTAGKIKNDNLADDKFYQFLLDAFNCTHDVMANDASIYVFHADTEGLNFRRAFNDAGFYLSGCCIWKKPSLVLGRSPYQWQHEPVLFGWLKNGTHQWYSDRKQTTIWEYDKPRKNADHPTMKPVPLLAYPILNSSLSNCIVLDPFGGSGSTLIACEQTNRICHTIELDEKYADVIVKRYIEQVGNSNNVYVERDGEKLPYSEVAVNEE